MLALNRQEPPLHHIGEGKVCAEPLWSQFHIFLPSPHFPPWAWAALSGGSLHLPEAELVPCHPTTPEPDSGGPRDLELPVGPSQVLGRPLGQKGSWHSGGYPSPGVGCEGLSQRPGSLPQAEGLSSYTAAPGPGAPVFPGSGQSGAWGWGEGRRGRVSWCGNHR